MKRPSQAGNLVGNSIMYTFAQCNIVQSVMYVSVFEYLAMRILHIYVRPRFNE